MKNVTFRATALLLVLTSVSYLTAQDCPELVWSDEFDGNALSAADWNVLTGDGCDIDLCGWGNNEAQWYQGDNVTVSDGTLKITARRQSVGGRDYTSARLTTKDKQDFRFGHLEARIKLPAGRGLWPAFWMLSTDEVYGGWPTSGEIDIMEWVGNDPEKLFGTIHFGQPWPNNQFTGSQILQPGESWSEEFHNYAVYWTDSDIRWYVDGYEYSRKTRSDLNGQLWPFDQDFHFILNVAVGGTLGGAITNADFPSTMEVDYVRVYEDRLPSISGERTATPGGSQTYTLANVPDGATVDWTVPAGATVAGTNAQASVVFGSSTGDVMATVTTDCGTFTTRLRVVVNDAQGREFSFENFDDEATATFTYADGTLTEIDNPAPNNVNNSDRVGRYVRDGSTQYDVVVYQVSNISNGDDYVNGERTFSIDINTTAPVGTEILLQQETGTSQPTNYPVGRHSRFVATTTVQNEWERLTFTLLDEPDANATATDIRNLILLFNSNSMTSDTYHYDNFDSYVAGGTGVFGVRQLDFPLVATPNPVADAVRLDFTLQRAEDFDVEVYSAAGQRVLTRRGLRSVVGTQRIELDLSDLAAGVYFARLRFGAGMRSVRLVRQ